MKAYATALALSLGAGAALYPIARTGEINAVSLVGAVGLTCLVLATASRRARSLVIPGVLLIGLHYALALHTAGSGADVYSVVFGVALFLVYETADLSISLTDVAPMTRPALIGRAGTTATVATAGALLATVALLARSLFSAGIMGVIIGAVCTLGLVALLLSVRSARPDG